MYTERATFSIIRTNGVKTDIRNFYIFFSKLEHITFTFTWISWGENLSHRIYVDQIPTWSFSRHIDVKKAMFLLQCEQCCSVTQSCLTLWLHGLQYARLFHPSPSPRVCSNSCPLSQCYPIIFSVAPFSSCLQSFPESRLFFFFFFPLSWLFASGGQNMELQIQHQSFQWILRVDLFDLLAVQGTLKSLLWHYSSKASIRQWILPNTSFMKENELSMGKYN